MSHKGIGWWAGFCAAPEAYLLLFVIGGILNKYRVMWLMYLGWICLSIPPWYSAGRMFGIPANGDQVCAITVVAGICGLNKYYQKLYR